MLRSRLKGASEKNIVYISIGSNLGDRRKYLHSAIEAIGRSHELKLLKSSGVSNTEPVDNLEQPDFLNQVVSVETQLQPHELLKILQDIEDSLGRERTIWKGSRTIDLDILLFDGIVLEDADLTIPHPELLNRPFFIRQILEIAPDIIDPLSQQSLSSFLRGRGNQR
jgi:2-amino-4-hydroxy-6-hydroxymethyldihydropteridine diphosphokinase